VKLITYLFQGSKYVEV